MISKSNIFLWQIFTLLCFAFVAQLKGRDVDDDDLGEQTFPLLLLRSTHHPLNRRGE